MTDDTFTPPETGPHAMQPRRVRKGHADDHWLSDFRYEAPREDPAFPQVYVYTDAMSYDPGDEVLFNGSTNAATWRMEIYRDGAFPRTIHVAEGIKGTFAGMPKGAYRNGCGWPVLHKWRLPADLASGFYRVVSTCLRGDGERFVQHHFFVVRPTRRTRSGNILVILPTGTWTAYNDWGGGNHYFGIDGETGDQPSPVLSLQRPWTRGMVWLPPGAPRIAQEPAPRFGEAPRFPMKDWGYANGFGQYYAAAGWAQYDRHFVVWAEREGFSLDFITQTDLHYRPALLDDYRCAVITGHDEYWTREMRLSIEDWVERGGRLARFGGNFMWQIRLEDDGRTQICYKTKADKFDPIGETSQKHLLTSGWNDRNVRWPGTSTVGVDGFHGIYASWGGFAPRGQRGFTVYRPEHWAFAGTGLGYADMFGQEASIFGYEVDGLDYTFRDGLPYPVSGPGIPETLKILAMAPAMQAEDEQAGEGFRYYVRDSDFQATLSIVPEEADAAARRYRRGCGVMVNMQRGKGEVLTAATCEWVMGLTRREPFTEKITRNVLERFSSAR